MMQKIKKCSHCNSNAIPVSHGLGIYHRVRCTNTECNIQTGECSTIEHAIEVWNNHSVIDENQIHDETLQHSINWEQRRWDMASNLFNEISTRSMTSHPYGISAYTEHDAINEARFCIDLVDIFIQQIKTKDMPSNNK